jgi:hypothetical protein
VARDHASLLGRHSSLLCLMMRSEVLRCACE